MRYITLCVCIDAMSLAEVILNENKHPVLFPEHPFRKDWTKQINDSGNRPILVAALHLWNDDLESCHRIVQQNELPDENYLHAILHRREKDFSNSLYWYRRVGKHPVLKKLEEFSPSELVDACENWQNHPDKAQEKKLREWQATEMRLLWEYLAAK